MTANKPAISPDFNDQSAPDDDLPDLTAPEWQAKFAKTQVRRGRPKATSTKISTTIRLDPEVLKAFKSQGPGWQSRINETLRQAVGLS